MSPLHKLKGASIYFVIPYLREKGLCRYLNPLKSAGIENIFSRALAIP